MRTALIPEPHFVDRDAAAVEAEMVAAFEAATGRTLYPAQVERLIIAFIAYRETLVRHAIQFAAEQNLVAFASYPMLDYLGELVGVERLAARPASTVIRFSLAAPAAAPVVVPPGTVVGTPDGSARVATVAELVIAAGAVSGEVRAESTTPGAAGNGYAPGALSQLAAPIPLVAAAVNVAASMGGADGESDDRLRDRIRQAPATFSVAGSAAAYRAHALAAHPDVADVAVTRPVPGTVRLTVLAAGGAPGADVLAAVAAHVSADTVRPLTDQVQVVAAAPTVYQLQLQVLFELGADTPELRAAVRAAVDAFVARQAAGLGRSVVASQLIAAVSITGVYMARVLVPAGPLVHVAATTWAKCDGLEIICGTAP